MVRWYPKDVINGRSSTGPTALTQVSGEVDSHSVREDFYLHAFRTTETFCDVYHSKSKQKYYKMVNSIILQALQCFAHECIDTTHDGVIQVSNLQSPNKGADHVSSVTRSKGFIRLRSGSEENTDYITN